MKRRSISVLVVLSAAFAVRLLGCSSSTPTIEPVPPEDASVPTVDTGVSCTGGKQECSGACVDVQSSAENCGTCGHACAAGQACAGGVCATACPAGQQLCGDKCVSLDTDSK